MLTLPAEEFIRRFLWHVLPERFVRIQYYGLQQNRLRRAKLGRCRELLGLAGEVPRAARLKAEEWLVEVLGAETLACPFCGGRLRQERTFATLTWLMRLFMLLLRLPVAGRVVA